MKGDFEGRRACFTNLDRTTVPAVREWSEGGSWSRPLLPPPEGPTRNFSAVARLEAERLHTHHSITFLEGCRILLSHCISYADVSQKQVMSDNRVQAHDREARDHSAVLHLILLPQGSMQGSRSTERV